MWITGISVVGLILGFSVLVCILLVGWLYWIGTKTFEYYTTEAWLSRHEVATVMIGLIFLVFDLFLPPGPFDSQLYVWLYVTGFLSTFGIICATISIGDEHSKARRNWHQLNPITTP